MTRFIEVDVVDENKEGFIRKAAIRPASVICMAAYEATWQAPKIGSEWTEVLMEHGAQCIVAEPFDGLLYRVREAMRTEGVTRSEDHTPTVRSAALKSIANVDSSLI